MESCVNKSPMDVRGINSRWGRQEQMVPSYMQQDSRGLEDMQKLLLTAHAASCLMTAPVTSSAEPSLPVPVCTARRYLRGDVSCFSPCTLLAWTQTEVIDSSLMARYRSVLRRPDVRVTVLCSYSMPRCRRKAEWNPGMKQNRRGVSSWGQF